MTKAASFDFEHRVDYVDTDKMGVVHNSNYFRYFEKGRTEIMRHLGLSYKEMEDQNMMMPLVEQFCKYVSPSYYDDVLIIRTTVDKMPSAIIKFNYEVYRKQENQDLILAAKGWNSLAFIDSNTRRPIRCPKIITDLFAEN